MAYDSLRDAAEHFDGERPPLQGEMSRDFNETNNRLSAAILEAGNRGTRHPTIPERGNPMTLVALLVLLIIGLPIAWFASEFYARRWLRLLLGILAIGLCCGATFLLTYLGQRYNYNTYYGFANKALLAVSIDEIEKGNTEKVVREWRRLRDEFQPTYENRADYDELVYLCVMRMKQRRWGAAEGPP